MVTLASDHTYVTLIVENVHAVRCSRSGYRFVRVFLEQVIAEHGECGEGQQNKEGDYEQ